MPIISMAQNIRGVCVEYTKIQILMSTLKKLSKQSSDNFFSNTIHYNIIYIEDS